MSSTKTRALAALAVMLVVLLSFVALFLARDNVYKSVASTLPMTSLTPSINTVAVEKPSPAPTMDTLGWQHVAGLSNGRWVAFGRSSPLDGYACSSQANSTLEINVSTDGGQTWVPVTSPPISGPWCRIYVDPYNGREVIASAIGCWDCINGMSMLARSLDSGNSWARLTVPPGNEASGATAFDAPVWTPTALYLPVDFSADQTTQSQSLPAHVLAVSIEGHALAWTKTDPFVAAAASTANFYPLAAFAVGAQYIIGHHEQQTPNFDFSSTTDGGATWRTFIGGFGLLHFLSTYDGRTAIGIGGGTNFASQLAVTRDGGASWQALPVFSPEVEIAVTTGDGIFFGNNGTIYAVGNSAPTTLAIYALTPGSSDWHLLTPYPNWQEPIAVSVNAAGLPAALWSVQIASAGGDAAKAPPGIFTYLLS